MEIINVEISHTDSEYAEALARYLSEKGRKYSLSVTKSDRIHKDCDGAAIVSNSKEKRNIDISGYLSPLELKMRISEELQLQESTEERKTKLILVTGLEGGAGATSVAEGLAQEFALYYGRKVARISFDALPHIDTETNDDAEGKHNKHHNKQKYEKFYDLKRLLYLWKKGDITGEIIKDCFLPDENNVFHIFYGSGINPLLRMESKEIIGFIDTVCLKGEFDYLVSDIPIVLYNLYYELSLSADKTILVSKDSKDKINDFMQKCKKDSRDNIMGVFNFANERKDCVKNEAVEDIGTTESIVNDLGISMIDKDNEIVKSNKIRIDGIFGFGIKFLAERVEF